MYTKILSTRDSFKSRDYEIIQTIMVAPSHFVITCGYLNANNYKRINSNRRREEKKNFRRIVIDANLISSPNKT